MTDTKTIDSWDSVFGGSPKPVQEIAALLRSTILKAHKDAIVTPKSGWGVLQFGFGKKNAEIHSYIAPKKDRVNLGFYQGATLSDPDNLLEGTGKALRHVKVLSADQATSKPIAALIDAAIIERRRALGVN